MGRVAGREQDGWTRVTSLFQWDGRHPRERMLLKQTPVEAKVQDTFREG